MFRKLRCWIGWHSGYILDGYYRCAHCSFKDPYTFTVNSDGKPVSETKKEDTL